MDMRSRPNEGTGGAAPAASPARANFETLLQAAKAGDLALMECTEVASGEPCYVLCAVGRGADQDGDDYVMTPFGHLAPGNSYDDYIPPA